MAAILDRGRARILARGLSAAAIVVTSLLATICRADSTSVSTPFGPDSMAVGLLASARATASARISINLARLAAGVDSLVPLSLPDSQSAVLVLDRIEAIGPDRAVWHGKVDGDPWSAVTFAIVHQAVAGSIVTSRGTYYHLRSSGAGDYLIEKIPPGRVPNERDPLDSVSMIKPDSMMTPPSCAADDPERIDVMVVYTAAARDAAGSDDDIEATIHLAMSETNQGYVNSGVRHRLNLVHFALVPNYVEPGDIGMDLNALKNPNNTYFADIHDWRDQYAADVVVLLIEDGGSSSDGPPGYGEPWCGYSVRAKSISPSNEKDAFSVVVLDCATGTFSFGHEIGHLLSARHERAAEDVEDLAFNYNHGTVMLAPHLPTTSPWLTMMGSKAQFNAPDPNLDGVRLLYYSDPSVDYFGDWLGSTTPGEEANNLSILNQAGPVVARYRCSEPLRADTWMKDAWGDTGAEPEPSLVDQPMWRSPYIWVRREADLNRVHAHQHQNPVFNQTNYVYVKLHNGTAGASGELVIYAAQASTGLLWPLLWERIATIPVTNLGQGETRIVEGSWIPESRGHVCLLARWVSPDDPMNFEGPSIEQNVRMNNNIIWRNLNVIDFLSRRGVPKATLVLHNGTASKQAYSVAIRPARDLRDRALFGTGAIAFRLDAAQTLSWLAAGGRGAGFERTGSLFRVTDARGAVLDGVRLGPGESSTMWLDVDLDRAKQAHGSNYEFDVVQFQRRSKGRPSVVGGVSYEVPLPRGK